MESGEEVYERFGGGCPWKFTKVFTMVFSTKFTKREGRQDDGRRAAGRRVAPRHGVTTSNGGGERCGGASDAENDASHASNVWCHHHHQRSDSEKGGIRGRAFEYPRVNAPLPRFFFLNRGEDKKMQTLANTVETR